MKKILALFLYLSIISLVIGCGNPATGAKNDNSSTDKNIDVTIILKEKHKEFERKEIKVKNKTDLQTAMNDNFKLELDNGLIISIAGKEQDNAKKILKIVTGFMMSTEHLQWSVLTKLNLKMAIKSFGI